ncbi:hypothetical protein [Fusibacter sp. JL216-2]|uniref:hypothetical protein n=1 Tax=Fusibacter sp. JL216-2 TaxID=3071453 RepID=UPI003D33DDA5
MRRITSMHLDVVTHMPETCKRDCLFISYLHEGHIKTLNRSSLHQRYSKKYTQLSFLITPFESKELPDEIVNSIHAFQNKINALDLEQNRKKIVNLIKYTIFQLNKTVQDWNSLHGEDDMVRLNLTIAFVYGDHLILFNFGKNHVYIYREGDLTTFNGSRLDNEKHFSLKTGREGKLEYILFEKQVPPIGEVDFKSEQIMTLFKITHRLLKGDMIALIAAGSIDTNAFRVNVNLFEQAVERHQLNHLIMGSVVSEDNGYAWVIMTFDEVREFRQTARYTLFRTVKGLLSFSLLLLTLLAPTIYRQQVVVDHTPVRAFHTPPTTAYMTILDNDEAEENFNLIPDISGTPPGKINDGATDTTELHDHKAYAVNKVFPEIMNNGSYPTLASYFTHFISHDTSRAILDRQKLIETISIDFYGTNEHSQLIEILNPLIDYQYIASHEVCLPVYLEPYMEHLTLVEVSFKYYGSTDHADYLMRINGLDSEDIPYKKDILVPPLYIYPE